MEQKEFSRTLERRIEKVENDISEIRRIVFEHNIFVKQSPKAEKHYEHHAFIEKTIDRFEIVYKAVFREFGRLIFLFFVLGILYWIFHANGENTVNFFMKGAK